MIRYSAPPLLLCSLLALAGCGGLRLPGGEGDWAAAPAPAVAPQPRPDAAAPAPVPVPAAAPAAVIAPRVARTPAALDRTTEVEKAAALAPPPAKGAVLGQMVVSLGNPAEQGFWLRSSLVTARRGGTVRLANGTTVQVDLLPAAGGGAQMSLATYRALGLALTELPQVTVLAR